MDQVRWPSPYSPALRNWPARVLLRVHLIPRRVRRVLSAEHKSPRRSNGMWQCIEQEAAILMTSDPRSFTGPASRGDRCGIVRSKLRERHAALERSYLLGIMSLHNSIRDAPVSSFSAACANRSRIPKGPGLVVRDRSYSFFGHHLDDFVIAVISTYRLCSFSRSLTSRQSKGAPHGVSSYSSKS